MVSAISGHRAKSAQKQVEAVRRRRKIRVSEFLRRWRFLVAMAGRTAWSIAELGALLPAILGKVFKGEL